MEIIKTDKLEVYYYHFQTKKVKLLRKQRKKINIIILNRRVFYGL